MRNGELVGEAGTFEQAAVAAEHGEPLIVVCTNPLEAVLMADLYARFGVTRPALDALNGDG